MRYHRVNGNVFSRRLEAASGAFGLRTGSGRVFQAGRLATAKSQAAVRAETRLSIEICRFDSYMRLRRLGIRQSIKKGHAKTTQSVTNL